MEKVHKPIIEVSLERELDLVMAYKKAMQLAEISGLTFTDQTKFATAVSEISRNALVHAGNGEAAFYIIKEDASFFIQAIITDQGPGIKNLGALLQKLNTQTSRQQTGIVNCQQLSDKFAIDSAEGKGTCVKIARRLPASHPPINRLILSGWRKHFSHIAPISPYDEIKRQNQLLLKTLEDLRHKELQTREQIEEIQSLNNELEHNYEKIKQLSNGLGQQNELLLKKNDELDQFAHILSHDLKSPVQNMQGLVQLIELGQIKDPEKMLSIFKGQLEKMERLIQSVLLYSRAGHEKVDKTRVKLEALLTEMIQNLLKPSNFLIEIKPDLPVLLTEEIFIYQVFNNLISNAVKYNDKVEGRLIVGTEYSEDGELFYFVEDNGPGIPLNKRTKAFNMFTKLHMKKEVDSSGIGLAIVKKIVNEKGGKIWIEDAYQWNTGVRFCFTWPGEILS